MRRTAQSIDLPSFTILTNGRELAPQFSILSLVVHKEVNRIPYAKVLLDDGDAARADFPASASDELIPGNDIEIKAGYKDDESTIFKGILLSQKIKVSGAGSCLWIEARDKAFRMTLTKKNSLFLDRTDSEVAGELLKPYELSVNCESTGIKHPHLIQYQVTDWDFLLSRTQANSKLVFVNDGRVEIKQARLSGKPVLTLTYGTNIIELEAEVDARRQIHEVISRNWDYSQQKVVESKASEPALNAQGNLSVKKLAQIGDKAPQVHTHSDKLADAEGKEWADALLLKSRMSMIRGRVTCQGLNTVHPGDLIELDGLGTRFIGTAFVSAVRHEFSKGDWLTDIQFGLDPEWFLDKVGLKAAGGNSLLPGISGLQIGTVVQISKDPDREDRIRVHLPLLFENQKEGVWARIAALDAGDGRGSFFRPEVGDEVVTGFLSNDPRSVIVLGMLNSSAKPAPITPEDEKNSLKGFYTRSKMKIEFDDEKKIITLKTPNNNTLELNEENKSLLLHDQNNNTITLDEKGICLESAKDISLKAKGVVKIEASGNCSLDGNDITISAKARFTAKGNTGAEMSTGAIAVLKGTLVNIN